MTEQAPYWFDAEPLTRVRPSDYREFDEARQRWKGSRTTFGKLAAVGRVNPKALVKEFWTADPDVPVREFAAANGFDHFSSFTHADRDGSWRARRAARGDFEEPKDHKPTLPVLPGVIFQNCMYRDVVVREGNPHVEIGRCETGTGDTAVDWGYVAIRHGRRLPHLALDARANDALESKHSRFTQAMIGSKRKETTSLSYNGHAQRLREKLDPLDLAPVLEEMFYAGAERGRRADVLELLSTDALALMAETCEAFDVEIVEDWVFLYGYDLRLVTDEPETWAWLFALISRWLDQLEAWDASAVATPHDVDPMPLDELPIYTRQKAPRPERFADLPRPRPDADAWDRTLWGTPGNEGLFT